MADRILRLHEVIARTGLGGSTIHAMMGRAEFPKPLRLGVRAVGWPESTLDAWLASRPATSGTA